VCWRVSRVLQCVAVCCSVLQGFAVYCNVLQCVALHCSMLQCGADMSAPTIMLQFVAMLRCVAVCCSALQCIKSVTNSIYESHNDVLYVVNNVCQFCIA